MLAPEELKEVLPAEMLARETNARLYKHSPQKRAEVLTDRVAQIKNTYEKYGAGRSNLAYGYVARKTV